MKEKMVTMPELGLIAGTRAAVGAGLGLLLADRIPPEQRRAVGWTLLIMGLLTTIPLAADVLTRNANGNGFPSRGGLSESRKEQASHGL